MAEKAITRRLKIFINGNEVDATLTNLRKSLIKFKAQSNAAVEGTPEWKKYNEEVARTEAELLQATAAQKKFREETGLGIPNLKESGNWLDKLKTKLGPVATGFLAAFSIGAVVGGAMSALRGAVKTINEFEQSVADLQAITGATGDDLEYLKNQAITLGAETKGGAVAVVEAYKLIASAKPELLENVEALNMVTEATLTLAQAAGMEMPAAATALTDAMNQFGADASQASVFVDALANGAKYGAAEIPDITEAVLKFGAVSRTSNIDIKESVALVELLAENGIKGAEAGTKLRNVLLKISAPDALPKEAQATFERLGISMEFLNDKTIPLQQKLEALKPLLKNNADIIEVFGLENATAAINVIEHTDRIGELTSKMGEVGTATEQASIKMNTVAGKTELLKGKYDSFILSVSGGGGVISNFFKFWIEGASNALTGLTRLNSSWDELYARAQGDGTAKGVKTFQSQFNNLSGTGNDAEIAKSVKESAKNTLYALKQSYEKNQKEIDEYNPWAHFSGLPERDLKVRKEELTKEIAAYNSIIAEANKKINTFENPVIPGGSTTPTTTPTGTETEEAKKAREEAAKKSLADKLKATKDAQDKLTALETQYEKEKLQRLAVSNEQKAQLARDEAINSATALGAKKELLDTIEAEHKIKIDAGKTADEEIELQKIADFELRKKTLQNEIDLQNATTQEEADALKLTIDLEKELTELDKLKLSEEQKAALKLKIIEKYNNDVAKIVESAALKRLQKQNEVDVAEINFEKQKSEIKINLAQQLGNVLLGILGNSLGAQLASIALNAVIEIAKLKIATSSAQQINLANATAAAPPPLNVPFMVAAAAQNIALGASSKMQQGSILASAAISGLGAALSKKKGFSGGGDTGFGNNSDVAGLVHKNEYVIPQFVRKDPEVPQIIEYLEAKRTGKETALSNTTSAGASNDINAMVVAVLSRLNDHLNNGLKLNYTLDDERERQLLQQKLDNTINASKK